MFSTQLVEGRQLGELDPFQLEEMRFLMSRESQTEPPQYFLWTVKTDAWQQITDFPHPYPQVWRIACRVAESGRS